MFGTKLCLMLLCCVTKVVYEVEGTGNPCCGLWADHGPCEALFRYFHYNFSAQRCEMFIYGGCEGNCNKFRTEDECRSKCDRDRNSV
ncbi:kunitz-type serine protease inhibitor 2-like [Bacillus rossius redtenbacheri]|uniref:kunitz-type serine protease inhibitor 2-like n=1 Tax=Bacillus rossius redtenbacheri TaxID=93214 RepID=UPI002FDEC12D